MAESRLRSIVFDCAHPQALARFWADALGYTIRSYEAAEFEGLNVDDSESESESPVVIDPPDAGPTIWFNQVPEEKEVKNRVHIDVSLDRAEDAERLVERGARILRAADEVPGERWLIMADPEGNEFCAFPPEPETAVNDI